ncbi:MafI family immunity protein [Dyadobacter sp. 676]|uniref:MafI family immunity protein n=1 Tax=Dyadobacter sp. 676 TaxID=3088362 RepID=A0AAU8FTH6_9BACT
MIGKSLNKKVYNLISKCESLGLTEKDCTEARSLLECNEVGLAFDTILTQMYEYDILIDSELYRQIEAIAYGMSLNSEGYEFMSKLIRPAK